MNVVQRNANEREIVRSDQSGTVVDRPRRSVFVRLVRGFFQLLLPLVLLAGAYATYSYLKATKPEAAKRPPRETVYSVELHPVVFKDHQPELTLYGTTVAGRQVELRSLVAGRVARAGGQLQAGGEVKTGDTLIEIDPFDYQISLVNSEAQLDEAKAKLIETAASIGVEQGNLQSAREQLQLAQTDLQRALPLAQRGAVSTRTVDDRRLLAVQRQQAVTQSLNTLRVWQARKIQQEAAVKRLEATVAQARKRLKETVLTAPFSAFVTDVGAQVGRMLNVNDRVATLIDRDWIDARFTLSDRQYGRLMGTGRGLVGRQVDVRWNVGASPLSYPAKIERVDGRVSTEDGGVAIYARIQDPRRPVQIRPGTFVEVRLSDKTFERVAKVSSQAVYNGDTVYVVVDGRLQARKVSIVGTSGSDLLVEGEIKEGEQMLLTRLARPGNGVRIKGLDSNGA